MAYRDTRSENVITLVNMLDGIYMKRGVPAKVILLHFRYSYIFTHSCHHNENLTPNNSS